MDREDESEGALARLIEGKLLFVLVIMIVCVSRALCERAKNMSSNRPRRLSAWVSIW